MARLVPHGGKAGVLGRERQQEHPARRQRVAAEGDEATKRAAAPMLIEAVRRVLSKDWRDRKRPLVMEANRTARLEPTAEQLAQLEMYAAEVAGGLFMPLAAIGGSDAIALLLEKAEDTRGFVELPKAAIAALSAHPPASLLPGGSPPLSGFR